MGNNTETYKPPTMIISRDVYTFIGTKLKSFPLTTIGNTNSEDVTKTCFCVNSVTVVYQYITSTCVVRSSYCYKPLESFFPNRLFGLFRGSSFIATVVVTVTFCKTSCYLDKRPCSSYY